MYAPISAPASTTASWDLEVQSLANAVTLQLDASVTVAELRRSIAEKLGIAATSQLWHLQGERLSLKESDTLETLEGVTQMTVLHAGEPLKALPKRFEIRLTSARERFRTGYSSAFTIQYRLRADTEKGEMVLEPWRKNDHDTLFYNSREKTLKAAKCHWMAGTQETTQALTSDPLADLVSGWRGSYLDPGATRFWKAASEPIPPGRPHLFGADRPKPQTLPDYTAVPGWFVAPENCEEIETDLVIGGKEIRRMLVNQEDGTPVRLAMSQCRVGPLHEDIEEYDIELRELAADQKLESDDW